MALLTAYFDESYGNEDAYSVAGYIATIEQWEQFDSEWRTMLAEFGVGYMRKSDLEHLQGDFKKWRSLPKPEQEALKKGINQKAISIIKRRVSAGFAASVKKPDWEAVDKKRWVAIMGSGFYAVGAKSCMWLVAGWAKEHRRKSIDYFYESGAKGAGELDAMIRKIHGARDRRKRYRLGKWGFGDGKPDRRDPDRPVVIQFQAADFLAYETYRHLGNRVVS
jgi:hypothetical protein